MVTQLQTTPLATTMKDCLPELRQTKLIDPPKTMLVYFDDLIERKLNANH